MNLSAILGQVFAPQMADAARFVADFPATTFVLVHAGMLEASDAEHVAAWRAGMSQLAAQPNVVVQLTGQGTFVHRVDENLLRLVTETVVDLFGSNRAMWGSNLPIEAIWTDFGTLVGTWLKVIAELPLQARRDILARTGPQSVRNLTPAYAMTSARTPSIFAHMTDARADV